MTRKMHIKINEEICKGCGLCVNFCPKKILVLSEKLNKKGHHPVEVTNESECIGCKSCVLMCPDVVIELYEEADTSRSLEGRSPEGNEK